jgi:hypothetical protein
VSIGAPTAVLGLVTADSARKDREGNLLVAPRCRTASPLAHLSKLVGHGLHATGSPQAPLRTASLGQRISPASLWRRRLSRLSTGYRLAGHPVVLEQRYQVG